uniref:Caspase family p20 domain-containing protein n=1 Tax=Plectus sambesii TaxID=2011161 RepID=A0A914VC82_9BILA
MLLLATHYFILKTADAAFIFILSLGSKAGILGVDEKELSLIDIFKMFNPANCPGLANKPKVFIVQTCGRETSDTTPTLSTQINDPGASQTGKKERTSQIDDILVAFSTGWGYKSVQD